MAAKTEARFYYEDLVRNRSKALLLAAAALAAAALFSIFVGSSNLTFKEVIGCLSGQADRSKELILNLRILRLASAVAGGAALAVSGLIFQVLLKNSLASSYTLGISHGAAFGAAFAIVVFKAGELRSTAADAVTISDIYTVSICAFVGGLLSMLLILFLSLRTGENPYVLVLAGMAFASLFAAGTSLIQFFAQDVQIAAIVFWTFGDTSRTTSKEIVLISLVLFVSLAFFLENSLKYNAISFGDDTALSLDVEVRRIRFASLLLATLASSITVAFMGIIGFVGLMVPHISRRIVGSDFRFLLPLTALNGATLLLLADISSRVIFRPVVLPVGTVTSFLGAFFFIYLILREKARW